MHEDLWARLIGSSDGLASIQHLASVVKILGADDKNKTSNAFRPSTSAIHQCNRLMIPTPRTPVTHSAISPQARRVERPLAVTADSVIPYSAQWEISESPSPLTRRDTMLSMISGNYMSSPGRVDHKSKVGYNKGHYDEPSTLSPEPVDVRPRLLLQLRVHHAASVTVSHPTMCRMFFGQFSLE